jgi:hypothetical protein
MQSVLSNAFVKPAEGNGMVQYSPILIENSVRIARDYLERAGAGSARRA